MLTVDENLVYYINIGWTEFQTKDCYLIKKEHCVIMTIALEGKIILNVNIIYARVSKYMRQNLKEVRGETDPHDKGEVEIPLS